MKKFIFIILLFFLCFNINGQNLNTYDFILLKIIPNGWEEGQLFWNERGLYAGGAPGPSDIAISNDYKIYIPDRNNRRINVYNTDIDYLYTIYEKTEHKLCHYTLDIRIDDYGNIICNLSGLALIKLDPDGNRLFYIEKDKIPEELAYRKNFFPVNDYIFFYDDSKEVRTITPQGEIKDTKDSFKILMKINSEPENKTLYQKSFEGLNHEQRMVKKLLETDAEHLFIGGIFYSADFSDMMSYFEEINRPVMVGQESYMNRMSNSIDIDPDDFGGTFIDCDSEGNSYWEMTSGDQFSEIKEQIIIVFSNTGGILTAFQYGSKKKIYDNGIGYFVGDFDSYPATGSIIAVAPNGNIYFMRGSEEGFYFWKVERSW